MSLVCKKHRFFIADYLCWRGQIKGLGSARDLKFYIDTEKFAKSSRVIIVYRLRSWCDCLPYFILCTGCIYIHIDIFTWSTKPQTKIITCAPRYIVFSKDLRS